MIPVLRHFCSDDFDTFIANAAALLKLIEQAMGKAIAGLPQRRNHQGLWRGTVVAEPDGCRCSTVSS